MNPRRRHRAPAGLLAACALVALPVAAQTVAAAAPGPAPSGLDELSIEELGQVQVTSVTGRPQATRESAASVFVITGEDIRRSAATSLPEALRLAPNLQVARLNAGQYAISARGFNNAIANKLLVLVDGRTVYSPLYSGVFWDSQDLVLDDIERIEVISGPGSTLWGANAVNGVINIITRAAASALGTRAVVQGGERGSRVSLSHGREFGENGAWRLSALRSEREATHRADGSAVPDAGHHAQVGLRVDWGAADNRLLLESQAYRGGGDGRSNLAPRLSGGHVLGRWQHQAAAGGNWELQFYADNARVHDALAFNDRTDTLDLSVTHAPALSSVHRLLWGFGYREAHSHTAAAALVRFMPAEQHLRWTSLFVQDEVQVAPRWRVTLGGKLETNVYTGLEFLPTLRASFLPDDNQTLWAGATRTVRAPARIDRDFYFPANPPYAIEGGPDFRSELADVFELGYRAQPLARLSYSATAFHSQYRRLRAGGAAPTTVENKAHGTVQGLETWATLDLPAAWRLSGGWVGLHEDLSADADAGANSVQNLGNDPRHQAQLRLAGRLLGRVDLDLLLRQVGALPAPYVASYAVADLRLAWRPWPAVEASVLAQNLGRRRHVEFDGGSSFGQALWVRLALTLP